MPRIAGLRTDRLRGCWAPQRTLGRISVSASPERHNLSTSICAVTLYTVIPYVLLRVDLRVATRQNWVFFKLGEYPPNRHSRLDRESRREGIAKPRFWMPAFAGMTVCGSV